MATSRFSKCWGPCELGEHGAVCLGEENNRFPADSLYLVEVRADGMDVLLGSVGVKLGLERTGDGVTDEIGELRVLEDAKPGINVMIDTFGSERAGLDVVQHGWVDEGAPLVRPRGNSDRVRELAPLVSGSMLLLSQHSVAAHDGIAREPTS